MIAAATKPHNFAAYVKPLQPSSGRSGKEPKHHRTAAAPLQFAPHAKKNPAAVGRRRAAASRAAAARVGGGGPPPPNGPRGRRPLGGWRAPRARAHRDQQTPPPKNQKQATQSLGASKTTIFRSGRPQLVENSARTHKKLKQTPKNVRISRIKANPANSTNLPGSFIFLI